MKPITLTKKDSGATVEEEVTDVCHRATPEIFCTCNGMRLLYVDCGNTGWNPVEYVKVNGQFALLTRFANHASSDPVTWWFMRDPSRNYEFSFHASTSKTDTNKIFLWWDDLKNLPTVEYGQWRDRAVQMVNCTDVTLNLKAENCGVGLYMHNSHGNKINVSVRDAGRGVHHQECHYNQFDRIDTRRIGKYAYQPDAGSSGNRADVVSFWEAGTCQSSGAVWITGADRQGNPTRANHIGVVHGGRASYGRFWPLDGSGVMFEQGVVNNTIDHVSVTNSFLAVQENSGMPGNRIGRLVALNCANTLDQSDSSQHGQADPLDVFAKEIVCINSGPFGPRTPTIEHAKVIGEHGPFRWRPEYPFYPDLPGYADFRIEDGVNLEAEVPQWWRKN